MKQGLQVLDDWTSELRAPCVYFRFSWKDECEKQKKSRFWFPLSMKCFKKIMQFNTPLQQVGKWA